MKNALINFLVIVSLIVLVAFATKDDKRFTYVMEHVSEKYADCALEHDVYISKRGDVPLKKLVRMVERSCESMPPNGPARPEWR